MSLFKKKQSQQSQQAQNVKVKDKECSTDDSCPMCHIPQDVVDQLKKNDNSKGGERQTGVAAKNNYEKYLDNYWYFNSRHCYRFNCQGS